MGDRGKQRERMGSKEMKENKTNERREQREKKKEKKRERIEKARVHCAPPTMRKSREGGFIREA